MNKDDCLCIVGCKVENSNEFYVIYKNRVYSYEQANAIVKKMQSGLKIYKIVEIEEIKENKNEQDNN